MKFHPSYFILHTSYFILHTSHFILPKLERPSKSHWEAETRPWLQLVQGSLSTPKLFLVAVWLCHKSRLVVGNIHFGQLVFAGRNLLTNRADVKSQKSKKKAQNPGLASFQVSWLDSQTEVKKVDPMRSRFWFPLLFQYSRVDNCTPLV